MSGNAVGAMREWGAAIWPEEILGMGPYHLDEHPPMGHAPAWRGQGGWVGDPDTMRERAEVILECFELGLAPCCGARLEQSSPGWVRCPTAYANGPRSDGGNPIEYQLRKEDGERPKWRVRECAHPFDGLNLALPSARPLPASFTYADIAKLKFRRL